METFKPKQLVSSEINNGEKYRNKVDSPQADAFNKLVEAILYAQQNGVKITLDTEISSTSENAVQNKVIAEALSRKLDKIEPTTNSLAVYSVSRVNGVVSHGTTLQQDTPSFFKQWMIPRYMSQDSGATINPYANGTLIVPEPKLAYQATNKKYVDDNFAPKTYTHNISFDWLEAHFDNNLSSLITLNITLKNTQSIAYTSVEQLNGLTLDKVICYDNAVDEDNDGYYDTVLYKTLENVICGYETTVNTDKGYEEYTGHLYFKSVEDGSTLFSIDGDEVFATTPEGFTDIVE